MNTEQNHESCNLCSRGLGVRTGIQRLARALVRRGCDVTVVHAGDCLDSVSEMLVAQEIGGAPVVDEDGKPIGVVSKSDLVRDHQMHGGGKTAGHVMTAFVATVPETASLSEVAELMAASGIHRVIVVSATGAVAGIVSTLDLLRWLAKPAEKETIPPPLAAVRARIPAARASVASLMGPRVVCVEPGVSADQLEGILVNQQISGVPVVETRGISIGVVSKTDLVNAQHDERELGLVLEPDGELEGLGDVKRATVNELMTRTAISVREHTSVLRAAIIMVEQAIHRVPVLTEDGTVVGLLSALDIVRWLAARDVDVASSASEMPKANCEQ